MDYITGIEKESGRENSNGKNSERILFKWTVKRSKKN